MGYRVVGSSTVIDNQWLTVRRDQVIPTDGADPVDFYWSPLRSVAGIIPVTPDGRVVIVSQYRHAIGRDVWEFPIGRVDGGETPLDAARREVQEETGYTVGRVASIPATMHNPGNGPVITHMFVGSDAALTHEPEGDPMEQIVAREVTIEELDRMVGEGAFQCADSVAAYYHAKLRGLLPCCST